MNAPAPGAVERVFAQFLELERVTRAAGSIEQLAYSLVNDGQALFGFRHAALVIAGKVKAVTGISMVEPNAPFVAFVEQAVVQQEKLERLNQPDSVSIDAFDQQVRSDWNELCAPHVFWLPLRDRGGVVFGGLWIARDRAWSA